MSPYFHTQKFKKIADGHAEKQELLWNFLTFGEIGVDLRKKADRVNQNELPKLS